MIGSMESKRDYLERRALEEEDAAVRAASEKARELHEELASRYRDAATSEPEDTQDELTVTTIRPKEFRILD
jgi:hypothetical protein